MIAITISYQEIWDVKFDYNTLLPRDYDINIVCHGDAPFILS